MPSEKKSPKKKVEKPSDLELAKAFALFDTDNSGELSLDELKAILCRPTKKSLTERQVARVLKKCDMDGDGTLNMEEMQAAWAQLGFGGQVQTHKETAKSAPPSFATLIAEGNVVPDEFDGPYVPDSYHANVTGEERGYRFKAGREEWKNINRANLAKLDDWSAMDPEYLDEYGIDPDYMFSYGTINGKSVNMQELRPEVIAAKQAMRACYDEAFNAARAKFGASEVFVRILALPEITTTPRQPGGEQLDILGLYKGALGAIEELWQYGQQVLEASGEAAGPRALVSSAWSIKKPCRVWYNLTTKYGGDISRVTDCARISIELTSAEALEEAANFLLQGAKKVCSFKNRIANPTAEGYRDLLFTVLIADHVCEVQLHLVAMLKAKRHAQAHTIYKLCQRVLKTPIVAKSTYCLEVNAKGELVGEGERNAEGKPEGRGTMVYASGNMYEGQWLAGKQSGEGRCTFALTLTVTLALTVTVTLTLNLALTLFPTLTPTRAPTLTP